MNDDSAKLNEVSINLFGISAKWLPDPTERKAAWSLYIELVTRIAVEPLQGEQGLLRETLNSLYSLFGTTREILKAAGPEVGASDDSVGGIAIFVLNNRLRPALTKWHPLLQVHEAKRSNEISPTEHERQWSENAKLREELEALRQDLRGYAQALAKIAGIKNVG